MKLSFYLWIIFLVVCVVALTEAIAMIVHGVQELRAHPEHVSYADTFSAGWSRTDAIQPIRK